MPYHDKKLCEQQLEAFLSVLAHQARHDLTVTTCEHSHEIFCRVHMVTRGTHRQWAKYFANVVTIVA